MSKSSVTDALTYVPPKEIELKPLNYALIQRLWTFTRPHKRLVRWLIFVVMIRSVQMPLMAWMIGRIIGGPITDRQWSATMNWTGALGLVAVTAAVGTHLRMHLAMRLGEAVVHDMRQGIFDHLQHLSMSYFDKTKVGRIIARLTSDVESVRRGIQEVLFVSMVGGGWMLVSAVMMAWVDWVLFLVVLGLLPIIGWLNLYFRNRLSQVHRAVRESFSRVTATLAESVMGIHVTQGYVRQKKNSEIFERLVEDHSQNHMKASKTTAFFMGFLELNRPLFLGLLLLVGGWRVILGGGAGMGGGGIATVGDLIMFFFLADLFFEPVAALGKQYNTALEAMAGGERVFVLLDTKPAFDEPQTPANISEFSGRVEFKNLGFEYVPDIPVLKDVNFVAEPGRTIALVGQTGSGKTTIVSLIAKFYLATEGQLLLDGHDIREIDSHQLHQRMGIVLQHNFLFAGTLADNIRLGRPQATDQQVIEAARQLDCEENFLALPEGFDTDVGERGKNLSMGQQQLICFCRAMLADPRILILDEATSAVDPMTEARIQKALEALLRGRTNFVVAHRLSTITHADEVLVLDQGRIVERGTHLKLLEHGGIYAGLYRNFIRGSEGESSESE
jgi:ABC-type multidrug transport system fused ATPase/permease subunit